MINKEFLNKETKTTNIISEEDTKIIISNTLTTISNCISQSLGPYGNTTIIRDLHGIEHSITKDGFTILKGIKFEGTMSNVIASMVKKISGKLVQTVGDGSTSSIVVAKHLYDELEEFFKASCNTIPRKDVLDVLKILEELIIEEIKKMSKKLTTKEELIKIASISNNNDTHKGTLVAEIYEELDFQGFINLELSPTDATYREITNGIELFRGYTKYIYANQKDKITAMYEDAKILLCNDELGEEDMMFIAELLSFSMAGDMPLIIIAKKFSSEITNILDNNKVMQKDKLKVVPIEYDLTTLSKHEEFLDLATYLGGEIYDKFNGERLNEHDAGDFFAKRIGKCNKIVIKEKSTMIIEGAFDQKEIDDRIKLIDDAITELNVKANYVDTTNDRYELERRKNRIKGKIANLFIGGSSDIEKKTNRDLVEDSIYACKSAIENGYIIGGNLIIPYILSDPTMIVDIAYKIVSNKELFGDLEEHDRLSFIYKILDLVKRSFSRSFMTVLDNKIVTEKNSEILDECIEGDELKIYNLKTNKYETIDNSGVINSTQTDIEIMTSVFSIIGLLASSNQMLATDTIYY